MSKLFPAYCMDCQSSSTSHAFVAPQEPATPRATVRRCTRHSPLHWHVDQGDFDVEFATEEEANAEAARLNTFGDTETPPAEPLGDCTCGHEIEDHALYKGGYCMVVGCNCLAPDQPVPAPLDSEPRAPTREYVPYAKRTSFPVIIATEKGVGEEIWLASASEQPTHMAVPVADLATHTRSLAALRSNALRVVKSYDALNGMTGHVDGAEVMRLLNEWHTDLAALRATLSEKEPGILTPREDLTSGEEISKKIRVRSQEDSANG